MTTFNTGAYPPGVTDNDPHFDSGEPPQEWHECSACGGEGQVFSHMHGSKWSIDPPFEVYEPCAKCNGDGGWLDERKPDSESDYCPYRMFTDEEEAAWERVFA